MLPPVKDIIEVDLKSHLFRFRRLTWKDVINQPRSKAEVLATALTEVSGRSFDYDGSLRLITSLPIPIQERVYTIFVGSQDVRRMMSLEVPWSAPDAVEFSETLSKEDQAKDGLVDKASQAFSDRFGQEALDEERELSTAILKQSGYKGAILKTKADAEEELS